MKVYLRRVSINTCGYDAHGNYWGVGQPLFAAAYNDGYIDWYDALRAHSREHAKQKIKTRWPQAQFYR